MRWMRRNARRLVESLYESLHRNPPYLQDYLSVGSDTETSGPPNSEGCAAGSGRGRERLTRSTSRPTERNRSTQEAALIDPNSEMDVDPIPSESEPSIAQQIDMISELETPAPMTPALRDRTLNKRRPRSVTYSEATRRSARHQRFRIFNIYNRPAEVGTGTLGLVSDLTTNTTNDYVLLLGDFNLHHPAWGGKNAARDTLSNQLLDLSDGRCLDLWLKPGTITRDEAGAKTTIDLVLGSQDLTPRLVTCEVTEKIHADSDHLPIRTLIDIQTKTPEAQRRRNWKACKVKELQTFVDLNLYSKAFPLENKQHIELAMEFLIETVNQGIATSTPWARSSKWANPSFIPECREMIKVTLRNRKGKVLARALRQGHRTWVRKATEAGPRGMWRVARWARNRDASGGLVPTLKTPDNGLAETAEQKVEVFRKAFFPHLPPADLSDIPATSLPQQLDFPDLAEHEVLRCIRKAPPDKAPGPDGIPNKVWHWLGKIPSFVKALTGIFNACIRLGHNPGYFQQFITVVLRKAAPRDYRIAKSYRPIALLNTLGKILEAAIATRIAYALEEHSLLPRGHLGGRKGISVDHLIQLLMDAIFDGWGRSQKVSMLLLDVAGAFDNVSHTRLLHNLKIARLGHFAEWLESFLSDRQTRLQLPGYLSRIISTPTGIPQGSPISPILFLLFNTPLIRALGINTVESMRIQPPISGRTLAFGWIDDTCTIALSGSYAANQRLLEWALDKAAVWSGQHSSRFAPDKFELIHFRNPLDPDPGAERDTPCDYTEPWNGQDLTNANREDGSAWEVPVEPPGHDQLPIKDHATGHVIRLVEHAKYLGIWLDKTLSFTTHCTKAVAKANGSLEALRSISASTWGTSLLNMQTIYLAVVVPQMLYGVAAWYSPTSGRTKYAKRQKTISEFERIQTRAAVLISGAFRNTASAALGAELFLPPVRLHMQQMIEETAIRIQTGPVMACPRGLVKKRSSAEIKRSGWSPMEALSGFNGHVGGAAVSIRAGKVRKKYLGAAADSTVYVGELEGVKMALKWAEAAPITVFSDSQAAIQAVQNPGRPSGQYVLRAIYERIRTLRGSGLQQEDIELRWIPAHIGIEGNERADEAAKRAAIKGIELSSVGPRELAARPITRLAAAAKTDVGKPTKRLIPKPNKKVLRIYEGLSKPQTSIIIQMRTMRIGLRHFLFKIKQVDSDRCRCELGSQTPKHVLMECSLHLASQRIMMERLDSIEGLRGRIQDYDAVMNHPQATRYVADFMQRTGLLQQFRFATFNDEKGEEVPEPSTLLEGLDLNEEDDGYIEQQKSQKVSTGYVTHTGTVDPTGISQVERSGRREQRLGAQSLVNVLARALRQGHRTWVRKARNRDASGGLVPTLKTPDNGLAETAEQKVEVFRKIFFPHPPPADLSDIPTTSLPRQLGFPDLAEHEMLRCIRKVPPDKAPEPDGIPNKVWHWLGEVPSFVKALTGIFNACIRLGHNPGYFQQSTTVFLRKAPPRDYRVAKSYPPIALLNTLGKILEGFAPDKFELIHFRNPLDPDPGAERDTPCGTPRLYRGTAWAYKAIRYVADFMQRPGLLQQFRFATFKDEEDEEVPEPSTLLEGLDLNEKDDSYTERQGPGSLNWLYDAHMQEYYK
ncbi:uncharacterized protein KD926_004623 [Aspergillus affinis]|uniref:uncharacterized protein n=1 Tax=Aspergillus affinis TaxID=1070780 RepID=UPI0022FE1230|nr:uncharacterized protein KD926_004623 [Aspergillus affinis]KAI9043120.1 hypothetical protein KD926_004623 [Aspergillus affinis]